MGIKGATAVVLALALAGCGQNGGSNWNPLNWFQQSEKVERMEPAPATPDDLRPLVQQVLSMTVEPMPGGAIVRATGLSPTQGWWAAELLPGPEEDGRLSFNFVIVPPPAPTRVSTQPSREVTAAAFVTNRQLETVREITVTGAQGARSSRR